jgi:AcrR family transcriptional regulator
MATAVRTRRRTQVDRSAETRAVLIRAAIELLQTFGFAGTTTALIAKRAGVTTGALHHHFTTKDELMFGVLDHASERVRARLEKEEHIAPGGALNLSDVVRHLWEVYGDPEYWAIWEIIIGTRSDPDMHQRIVAHRLDSMRTVLHPWLKRHTSGESPRSDVITLFEFMLIAIRGLSLERFLDKDDAYFDRNLKILADLVGQRLETLAQHDFVR